MANQQTSDDDAWHYDDVYIGPPVPTSVFYKGFRPHSCKSFKTTSQLAALVAAERERELERQRRSGVEQVRQRRAQQRAQRKLK